MSGPYSPYGQPGGGPYSAPSGGPYGAPNGGQYGAPSAGQYGQPAGGPYGTPDGSQYGQPGGYGPQGYGPQRGYLQGGPVDFQSAIKLQFENVTNFEGRASLSAYWWYALALFIVDIVLEIFSVAIGSLPLTLLVALVMIAVGLSGLSVGVRRLHDTDKSGWLLLIGFIPFLGAIVLIVLLALPGTPSQNRFG